jgi:hypothetical protein
MLTPYQIADLADLYVNSANRAMINKLFRKQDESHLFPICGRFNATDRAIRRLQEQDRQGACIGYGLEYALALDGEISNIVNSAI